MQSLFVLATDDVFDVSNKQYTIKSKDEKPYFLLQINIVNFKIREIYYTYSNNGVLNGILDGPNYKLENSNLFNDILDNETLVSDILNKFTYTNIVEDCPGDTLAHKLINYILINISILYTVLFFMDNHNITQNALFPIHNKATISFFHNDISYWSYNILKIYIYAIYFLNVEKSPGYTLAITIDVFWRTLGSYFKTEDNNEIELINIFADSLLDLISHVSNTKSVNIDLDSITNHAKKELQNITSKLKDDLNKHKDTCNTNITNHFDNMSEILNEDIKQYQKDLSNKKNDIKLLIDNSLTSNSELQNTINHIKNIKVDLGNQLKNIEDKLDEFSSIREDFEKFVKLQKNDIIKIKDDAHTEIFNKTCDNLNDKIPTVLQDIENDLIVISEKIKSQHLKNLLKQIADITDKKNGVLHDLNTYLSNTISTMDKFKSDFKKYHIEYLNKLKNEANSLIISQHKLIKESYDELLTNEKKLSIMMNKFSTETMNLLKDEIKRVIDTKIQESIQAHAMGIMQTAIEDNLNKITPLLYNLVEKIAIKIFDNLKSNNNNNNISSD